MEEPGQAAAAKVPPYEIVRLIEAPLQEENERKSQYWERLRRIARANGLNRRESYQWATDRVAELWVEPEAAEPEAAEAEEQEGQDEGDAVEVAAAAELPITNPAPVEIIPPARARDEELVGVQGLGDLPPNWPTLPPNASLTAEIQWVQANRLRVIVGGFEDSAIVDLSRALVPAPSHSAIGWLETSIRAYAKYCDIAAKATQNAEDEKEHVRRERLAIEEIRGLLAEMLDAG